MKTVFDKATRDELINRIHSLSENNKALWGKMNVYQMTKHCILWDNWVQGKTTLATKRGLMGWIFGRMALKSILKDDRPLQKNMPSGRNFIIRDLSGDVEAQKKSWQERIIAYENFSNHGFVHDFFGKMTVDQIGCFAYKHADHHLRQFNA